MKYNIDKSIFLCKSMNTFVLLYILEPLIFFCCIYVKYTKRRLEISSSQHRFYALDITACVKWFMRVVVWRVAARRRRHGKANVRSDEGILDARR